MSEHTHRPTYLSFMNTRRVCRCKHCDKPLKCRNRWLLLLCALPAVPAMLLLIREGLQHWPVGLAAWALCFLLQLIVFRFLKFEVDVVAQRDIGKDRLRR